MGIIRPIVSQFDKKGEAVKTKLIVVLSLVGVLVLSACGVPQEKMDEANAKVTQLTADLAAAKARIESLQTQSTKDQASLADATKDLQEARNSLTAAQNQVSEFNRLLCKQTWDFAAYKTWGVQPLSIYPDVPKEIYPYLFVTQWKLEGPLNPDEGVSVLLFDIDRTQSIVVDTVNDCVIVNPSVFPFGQ